MSRTVLSKHKTFDEAKAEEARLISERHFSAEQLQVRRKSTHFEVVVRE